MKSVTFVVGMSLFLALTVSAMAADINGEWIAPNDGANLEFEFKVKGDKLKGEVYNPLFGKSGIKDGTIDGDNFSFYIIHPTNNINNEQRVVFEGVITDPVIRIKFRSAGRGLKEVVAVRKSENKTPTVPAVAIDINGKWIAPNDGVNVEFEFKVKGNKLKGKVNNPMFGKMGIKDGTIAGDNFSFYVVHPTNQQRVVFKGVITDPVIRITFRSAGRGPKEIVATRKLED